MKRIFLLVLLSIAANVSADAPPCSNGGPYTIPDELVEIEYGEDTKPYVVVSIPKSHYGIELFRVMIQLGEWSSSKLPFYEAELKFRPYKGKLVSQYYYNGKTPESLLTINYGESCGYYKQLKVPHNK
jgi:hypothetical protein